MTDDEMHSVVAAAFAPMVDPLNRMMGLIEDVSSRLADVTHRLEIVELEVMNLRVAADERDDD